MKAKISELVDGELEHGEAARALDAMRSDGEARETWRSYHLIGDAMRDSRMLSRGFAARVSATLAQEPTVMAPVAAPLRASPPLQRPRWQVLSAAASLAAVALVGWVAFGLQQDGGTQLAKAPPKAATTESAQVAPPAEANDYLYAHQGYSPRNSLQGVAPYVRMVSGEAGARPR
ncbi:MAG: sigma-E factor negative regulatory protein [Candidatus Parcubacteria bacterium]|nr:sigma-E factor negative regulatory protein [Burkholderiales bacterium]